MDMYTSGLCSRSQSSVSRNLFRCSFCTRLIDSTPPATATGTRSTITRWAAIAIAWRPEEQKRLTVVAAAVTGRPARSAAWRAMLWPGRALGHRAADHDVLDLGRVEPRALDGVLDDVTGQGGPVGVVERAPVGLADGRAGRRDDHCLCHGARSSWPGRTGRASPASRDLRWLHPTTADWAAGGVPGARVCLPAWPAWRPVGRPGTIGPCVARVRGAVSCPWPPGETR